MRKVLGLAHSDIHNVNDAQTCGEVEAITHGLKVASDNSMGQKVDLLGTVGPPMVAGMQQAPSAKGLAGIHYRLFGHVAQESPNVLKCVWRGMSVDVTQLDDGSRMLGGFDVENHIVVNVFTTHQPPLSYPPPDQTDHRRRRHNAQ